LIFRRLAYVVPAPMLDFEDQEKYAAIFSESRAAQQIRTGHQHHIISEMTGTA